MALVAACGKTRDSTADPNAGSGNEPADAALPSAGFGWLALVGSDDLELVRFDGLTAPSRRRLASSALGAVASFSADGTRLAYAVRSDASRWRAELVSVARAESEPLGLFEPLLTPTLVWAGAASVVARAGSAGESYLLRPGAQPLSLGALLRLDVAANQSAAIAVSEGKLLYLSDAQPPYWSRVLPGNWLPRLADDGRGVATFSNEAQAAFEFPIATSRIQWSAPEPAPCTPSPQLPCPAAASFSLGVTEWPAADLEIVGELDATVGGSATRMGLVTIPPEEAPLVSPPQEWFGVRGRAWGLAPDGARFIVENSDSPHTDGWWLDVTDAGGRRTRWRGALGFAQLAALSADALRLFVVNYTAGTSTLYGVDFPPSSESKLDALFTTQAQIFTLQRAREGSGVLIETEDAYLVSDGSAQATPLPSGVRDVQWTPNGGGFVAIQNGDVVYLDRRLQRAPQILGRGGFVLPSRW